MRRTAKLLAPVVVAAGLLAACDLPAGTPSVISPDSIPNDSVETAPALRVPTTFSGTVGGADEQDVFRLTRFGPQQRKLTITCSGGPSVRFDTQRIFPEDANDVGVQSAPSPVCDGEPYDYAIFVGGEGETYLKLYPVGEDVESTRGYTITITVGDVVPSA